MDRLPCGCQSIHGLASAGSSPLFLAENLHSWVAEYILTPVGLQPREIASSYPFLSIQNSAQNFCTIEPKIKGYPLRENSFNLTY